MEVRPGIVNEWREVRVVEIHHHHSILAGLARMFSCRARWVIALSIVGL